MPPLAVIEVFRRVPDGVSLEVARGPMPLSDANERMLGGTSPIMARRLVVAEDGALVTLRGIMGSQFNARWPATFSTQAKQLLQARTNPPTYRVVQDDRHHYAQTGIMRSFILEGPRGATVAVWEYANAAMRVVNTKGQEPPAVQRDAALAAVRAYLKGR